MRGVARRLDRDLAKIEPGPAAALGRGLRDRGDMGLERGEDVHGSSIGLKQLNGRMARAANYGRV